MHRPFVAAAIAIAATSCGSAPPATRATSSKPLASASAATPVGAPRVLRFDVLAMGHRAGGETVTIQSDGTRDCAFEFNDRGRGPKLTAHVEVDAEGAPTRIDVTGNDYLKVAVDERLRTSSGHLSWKNRAEQGVAPAGDHAVYVPFEGLPELGAVTARALVRAPDHARPLLPAGRATIEKGSGLVVEAAGSKMHVTRWDVIGLGLEPSPLWLDDDGEYFANVSPWQSVVREGWGDVVPRLIADQQTAQGTRLEKTAASLAHPAPEAGLALVNARIFDSATKKVAMGTVVIKGDRIAAMGPAARTPVPKGAQTIDVAGKTVLPGLWDMHQHVSPLDGVLDVAAGVTSSRDLANDMDQVKLLRASWDAGKTIGPRLVLAGFIDGRGPYQGPTKVFADSEIEGRADVDMYASQGYEQIKIYSSVKPAIVPAIIAEAHAKGLRVSGHVPSGMLAADAVSAGFDELQHMNFVFLNFLSSREDDTRTPLRFTRVAEKGPSLDLGSPQVRDFIKLLLAHHTVIDPTLNVFEDMFTDRDGTIPAWAARVADRLPVQVRRGLLSGGNLPLPDAGADQRYRDAFAAMLKMAKVLYDAGVTLVAGTDSNAGWQLHRELELYAMAGIPAPDVLALATLGAARIMKRDKELGSLAPGKYADLVIIDGKPDVDMTDIEKVVTTVKGGVVYSSADLYGTMGVGPSAPVAR